MGDVYAAGIKLKCDRWGRVIDPHLVRSADIERSWTADERAGGNIKSQETVRIPCNADPSALPDFAGFVVTPSHPQQNLLGIDRAHRADDQPATPQ
jgi:hypothetical protein